MPPKAYSTTKVPVGRSQDELRTTLRRFGADEFSVAEGREWAGVEFVHSDMLVRLRCPVRPPADSDLRARAAAEHTGIDKLRDGADEHERERVWRVLVHSVKARLVSVEEGVETFEEAFLSHLVDPVTNRTVWEATRDAIEAGALQRGGEGLRALNPARP